MTSKNLDRTFTLNELYFSRPEQFNDLFDCRTRFTFKDCNIHDVERYFEHETKVYKKDLSEIKRKSEYVFCDPETAKPYNSIKTTFGKAIKRAGLLGLRFHDIRHTAATIMVMSGIDLITAGEILGHSAPKMTKRYVHPTTEGKMNAVKALERQMEDLDGLNTGSTVKVVSMPKVVSDSNN